MPGIGDHDSIPLIVIGSRPKVLKKTPHERGEDLRIGTLVGQDKYGNRYYENNNYFVSRHRWVEYRKDRYWDFDASLVPPDWHRWLHCMTDDAPTKVSLTARKFLWEEHEENLSGSKGQYVPSTTTRPKIEEWVPPTTN